jgi:LAO/AO transport system kinase
VKRAELTLEDFLEGFKTKNRTILARAITLVESEKPSHQELAQQLLQKILPATGKAKRIGISGTPGVGKSTFIESFGKFLTNNEYTVAVLAVDPTSKVSGGSILGDKTRMNELAVDPMSFIRPSPSGETLGGVARRTREAMLLCEAFGFDIILIETVGVGQSEVSVAEMSDFFMMLLQPGSGDDLQGIKRGILELVDMVVVTKDDGDNKILIQKARHDYEQALHILRHEGWTPRVRTCSAVEKTGIDTIWNDINHFYTDQTQQLKDKRQTQLIQWMDQLVKESLLKSFASSVGLKTIESYKEKVRNGELTPYQSSQELLKLFMKHS